jgi:hypothetical protein
MVRPGGNEESVVGPWGANAEDAAVIFVLLQSNPSSPAMARDRVNMLRSTRF